MILINISHLLAQNGCLNGFKYSKGFYLTQRWDLTGTTTLDQSGPGGNGNKWVLHISQSSRTRASPSDTYYQDIWWWWRNAVGVFYSLNRLGKFALVFSLYTYGRKSDIFTDYNPVTSMMKTHEHH